MYSFRAMMGGTFLSTSYVYMNLVMMFIGMWSIAQHENADAVLMVRQNKPDQGKSVLFSIAPDKALFFQPKTTNIFLISHG